MSEPLKLVAQNKKARHEYHIEESFEAGIVLKGPEVKSLRQGKASIKEAYAAIQEGEIYLLNAHIAPYEAGNRWNVPERRPRKLLLHSREINRLIGGVTRKGYTIVPLKLYLAKNGLFKVQIALARGKKIYDKRETIKRRDMERDAKREMKLR